MNLDKLLQNIDVIETYGRCDVNVAGLSDDSRKIKDGFTFVAIKGETVDGHDYISTAIEKGANVVIGELEPDNSWLTNTTYVRVDNSRRALSYLASNWFSNPQEKLRCIGVTGTDGKTTTANIIYSIIKTYGKSVGLISTISAKVGDDELETGFHVTNPEPLQLFEFLRNIADKGCEYCVIEVTSHGIHQHRIDAIDFEVCVLTNITHEHLDYHKTFEDYRDTKLKFLQTAKELVVLNKDDANYEYVRSLINPIIKILSYSTKSNADVTGELMSSTVSGMNYKINSDNFEIIGQTNLVGEYNLQNILSSVAVARYLSIDDETIVKSIERVDGLKGRMEEIVNDRGIRIIVDFAHTPNSLEKVLSELRQTTKGKLIAVFGCAGLRDIEKRQTMPAVSTKYADICVFTAEDPRTEDLEEIFRVMEESAVSSGASKLDLEEIDNIKTEMTNNGI